MRRQAAVNGDASRRPDVRAASPIDIVSRLNRVENELSRAERRVAETVRQDFQQATRLTIAELAIRAGVSQPTVTRFCRSLGAASYADFKIQLATTLTVASVYLRSDRVFDNDVGQLAQTVMTHAANAIRDGVDQLDTSVLSEAIDRLVASRRIDIYGLGGGSASVVEDAKLRFFRLGVPVAAFTDAHQQRMSAATLRPGDTAFAISNSGRSKSVIEAIEIARSFGATTLALTRAGSPLADAAEIVITLSIPEVDDVLRPTPSRYAQMAVIDTLATGFAARLGDPGRETLRRVRYALTRVGVAIATPSMAPTPFAGGGDPRE